MKIVINRRFGGFSLSKEAVLWLREHDCQEAKDTAITPDELDFIDFRKWYDEQGIYTEDYILGEFISQKNWIDMFASTGFYLFRDNSERSNPLLVQCVEELGSGAASGKMSELSVVEIPNGVSWEIDDYDGMETIHEQHRSWA